MTPAPFATFAALLVLFGIHDVAARAAAEPLPVNLRVRIYDRAGIPDEILGPALAVAEHALSSAGVRVDWVRCTITTASCGTALGQGEISVRLMNAPDSRRPSTRLALGDALIDTQVGGGVLATAYVNRVGRLADGSRTAMDILLGRVIAHEVGHLLLGTTAHSRDGLMRAHWSPSEVQRRQERDWVFTDTERDAIQARRRRW